MTAKEYEVLRNKFLTETLKLSDEKRIEYTEGNHETNVLWNFENIANTLNLTPMQVLSVYLQKHTSSLFSYFKTGKEYAEPIEGRMSDFIKTMELVRQVILGYEPPKPKRKYKRRAKK
jgi:L-rhamnose mutarotase